MLHQSQPKFNLHIVYVHWKDACSAERNQVMLIYLKWFYDIGGIDDHHCLNFLFIMTDWSVWVAKQVKSLTSNCKSNIIHNILSELSS
jgi:hypothetical protein